MDTPKELMERARIRSHEIRKEFGVPRTSLNLPYFDKKPLAFPEFFQAYIELLDERYGPKQE